MPFSKRSEWSVQINALSALLAEKRGAGERVLDLSESNPTRCGFSALGDAYLTDLSHEKNKIYEPDPRGLRRAREAVAASYAARGCSVDPERVFLTAGTSEAYSYLFRLLADASDSIWAPTPGYPLLHYLAGLNDLKIERYLLTQDTRWNFPLKFKSFPRNLNPRAMILVNPNNPTGNYLQAAEADSAVDWCLKYEAAILSDEVFFDFPLQESVFRRSLASENRVLTFVLGGVSKTLGLPQMKLSWIVVNGPPRLLSQALEKLEIISDTYLSVGTPAQRALPGWLEKSPKVTQEIRSRLLANLSFLEQALRGVLGVRLRHPEGGWYTIVDVEAASGDDEAFCLELLRRKQVMVHPGYFFDIPSQGSLVLSLLPPTDVFREGVLRLIESIT